MLYEAEHRRSLADPEDFWGREAERVAWSEPPKSVLSKDADGLFRWFAGGKLNISRLALDRHIDDGRGEDVALIYDSPVTATVERITFRELRDRVARFAAVLENFGIEKGDRVLIYMPMMPETVVAMLACARLGAVHSVVFGGFAAHELALRIDDARPKLILTASAGIEFSKIIAYKPIIEAALAESEHQPAHVIVLQRPFCRAGMTAPRDLDWHFLEKNCWRKAAPVEIDATDTLYILYTSGTTGKPKGIVRDAGGTAVALLYSMEKIYGTRAGDVFWSASDVGWVVGHSYIVYGPLLAGCTTVLFEGKPVKTPDAGAFWRVISEHRVNVFFTAPTAFRAIKKEDPKGDLILKYDLSSLRTLFLAGERCDISTLEWAENLLKIPVIDHWWQTESGWPMLANPMGVEPFEVKKGSAGKPVAGFDIQILSPDGEALGPNQEGAVAVRLPLPPGCLPTLWQNPERFFAAYLSQFDGYYFTGDGGWRDADGYFFITGRIDDVINVAGHRLSTADMEEIVSAHFAVAECAVVGIADELKGQIPLGLVVIKMGLEIDEKRLEAELILMVRDRLGAVACFKNALVVPRLPKTRSGKILRRTIRDLADGRPFSMPSTIEDPTVLDEIRMTLERPIIIL